MVLPQTPLLLQVPPVPQITWLFPFSSPPPTASVVCAHPQSLLQCFGDHKMPLLKLVLGMLISCNYSNLMEETRPWPLEMFSLMGEGK